MTYISDVLRMLSISLSKIAWFMYTYILIKLEVYFQQFDRLSKDVTYTKNAATAENHSAFTLIGCGDSMLTHIAQMMVDKLMKYDAVPFSQMEKLAKLLDLRFGSDILEDADILRRYVVLPSKR